MEKKIVGFILKNRLKIIKIVEKESEKKLSKKEKYKDYKMTMIGTILMLGQAVRKKEKTIVVVKETKKKAFNKSIVEYLKSKHK